MNYKSVFAVLLGAVISIVGVLEFYLSTPEARDNPAAKFGMAVFMITGCAVMIIAVLFHKKVSDRFFLAGVGTISLAIPFTMLGFFLSRSKWHWAIWFFIPVVLLAGLFMVLHGIAKNKSMQIVPSDDFVLQCSNCEVAFPLTCGGDPGNNGCT